MALHELHPLQDGEIAKLPQQGGVYVLFQVETAVHVDSAGNLRQALRTAKTRFPQATHLAVETLATRAMRQRVRQLKKDLSRVRKAGFVGSAPGVSR